VNFNTDQNRTGVALWRQGWYEYTADPSGNHFLKNKSLGSVAELGAIYDPVRHEIGPFRSQGATLRIGHSDSPTNNRASSTNSFFVNWLGGRGSDDVTSQMYSRNAFLLLDVFRTDDLVSGKVNPNALVRDPTGIVFRTLLDGFAFETADTNQASSALKSRSVSSAGTVAELRSFATNSTTGFLVSVGDISRAPLFWGTNSALAGVSMQSVSDAGREEFMRRSANLMNTQSLSFTIFVRAQAGGFQRNSSGEDKFKPSATVVRETVVQFIPTYPVSSDPTVPVAPSTWSVAIPRSISY